MNPKIAKQLVLAISIIICGFLLSLAPVTLELYNFISFKYSVLNFKVVIDRTSLLVLPVFISLIFTHKFKTFLRLVLFGSLFLFIKNPVVLFLLPVFMLQEENDPKLIKTLGGVYLAASAIYLWGIDVNLFIFTSILVFLFTNVRSKLLELILILFVVRFYSFNFEQLQLLLPLFGLLFLKNVEDNFKRSTPWILLLIGIDFSVVVLVFVIFTILSEVEDLISDGHKAFLTILVYTLVLFAGQDNPIFQVIFMGIWILELLKVGERKSAV